MAEFKALGQLVLGDVVVWDTKVMTVRELTLEQLVLADGARTLFDLQNPAYTDVDDTIPVNDHNRPFQVLVLHSQY